MSYILDALKKSEAERTRGVAPSLLDGRPVHVRPRAGAWVLLAALLINAAIGAFWIFSSDTLTVRAPVVSTIPNSGESAPIPTARFPASASDLISPTDSAAPSPVDASQDPEAGAPSAAAIALADLKFTTHVYADDPSLRAVTLNGRRLVEGDVISAGIRLQEVTETGVVINADGRSVALEVLQDWH